MKEKMLKINLLLFYREKQKVMQELQNLGILHLETKEVVSDDLEKLQQEKNSFIQARNIIHQFSEAGKSADPVTADDPKQLKNEILKQKEIIDESNSQIDTLKKEKQILNNWGKFEWDYIKRLEPYELHFHFFSAPLKDYRKFDFGGLNQFLINQSKSQVYFIVITRNDKLELPFDEIHLPPKTIETIDDSLSKEEEKAAQAKEKIQSLNQAEIIFTKEITSLEDQINYLIAGESCSAYAEGKIEIIQGWFPNHIEPQVQQFLDENGLSYTIETPTREDKIPVILKNKGLPKRFEPITKIFQLPSYYEYDLTPMIAVFYPIFFAYCLGDAGYGLVLIVVSFIARHTFLKDKKIFTDLGMILGIVSLILGIIKAGTLFGIPIIENQDVPFFNYLSQFILVPDDPEFVFNTFNVALMIGLFQIILGVFIAIFRKIKYEGFIYSVATIGKLLMIIGAVIIFLGGMQEVALIMPYTTFGWVSLITGTLLVLLFHDPSIPMLKRIGGGLLPIYFIFTGLLGDTLSYIRLFALGVASSILGLVVNQIGNQIMTGGIIALIGGIIFLIFGHSLNLALASLGSFVHPLRLTFVEFYNNAEFKGGGIAYTPFKKQIETEHK